MFDQGNPDPDSLCDQKRAEIAEQRTVPECDSAVHQLDLHAGPAGKPAVNSGLKQDDACDDHQQINPAAAPGQHFFNHEGKQERDGQIYRDQQQRGNDGEYIPHLDPSFLPGEL